MIQLRESALLGVETFAARGRDPGVAQNFNRDFISQILALGEVHDAHAAFTQRLFDSVRTKFLERKRSCARPVQNLRRDYSPVTAEQRSAARVFFQEDQVLADQRPVASA